MSESTNFKDLLECIPRKLALILARSVLLLKLGVGDDYGK